MLEMLYIAWDNIKAIEDRAHFYVDNNVHTRVLNLGKKVFLDVPPNSKTLCMGKWSKLAPSDYGPFIVLDCKGSLVMFILFNMLVT